MANIAITSQCNLDCSYCFTQQEYKTGKTTFTHMPLSIYKQALDFIARSDIKQIRILGGEPTLHPEFIPFLHLAINSGHPVRLFTNGMMPPGVLKFIKTIEDDKITVVLNITCLAENSVESHPILTKTLSELNTKIMLGFNIFKKNLQMDFLLDLAQKYGLKKSVRLGLTHPCIGYRNQYLLPKHYCLVGQQIADFYVKAGKQSVKINLDCGFVPCMFEGTNFPESGLDASMGTHCEPIPDILPDGSVVPCYPLSEMDRKKLNSTLTVNSIREQFREIMGRYHTVGIFKICPICKYRHNSLCSGGCFAQKILRFHALKNSHCYDV